MNNYKSFNELLIIIMNLITITNNKYLVQLLISIHVFNFIITSLWSINDFFFYRSLNRWIKRQQNLTGQPVEPTQRNKSNGKADGRIRRTTDISANDYSSTSQANVYFTTGNEQPLDAANLLENSEKKRSEMEKMHSQMMEDQYNEFQALASESALSNPTNTTTPRKKSPHGRGRGSSPTSAVGQANRGRVARGRPAQQHGMQRGGRNMRLQGGKVKKLHFFIHAM